ncbi:MAG: galactose-1-phosphate uridylyltransferase [Dethiobacter sp.]|nr:MAG: galactose-1-phosphate uridylyltransferase [Dethiobacter sp.]
MPILRQEPLTGEWVIIATDRARRPETFAPQKKEKKAPSPARVDNCPFCYGNEHMTPPEVLAYRDESPKADTPGWSLRVIPNKFPALEQSDNGEGLFIGNFFESCQGYGVHEVIIETPEHNRHLPDLNDYELALVLKSFEERLVSLAGDPKLKYVQIFRNHLREAGASIEHPHCQLLALPFTPPLLDIEYRRCRDYYEEEGRCLLCTLLEEEEKMGDRVVLENDSFLAFIPFAAPLPFTTWIAPRGHASSLEVSQDNWEAKLVPVLKGFLSKLSQKLEDPPYNLYLHLAPLRSEPLSYYHWHMEIIPKLTIVAGLEMATGTYINVSKPEEAAKFLREQKVNVESYK